MNNRLYTLVNKESGAILRSCEILDWEREAGWITSRTRRPAKKTFATRKLCENSIESLPKIARGRVNVEEFVQLDHGRKTLDSFLAGSWVRKLFSSGDRQDESNWLHMKLLPPNHSNRRNILSWGFCSRLTDDNLVFDLLYDPDSWEISSDCEPEVCSI